MNGISTHILDLVQGKAAANVPVRLEKQDGANDWRVLTSTRTDHGGRCSQLLPAGAHLVAGVYRLSFDTASYFKRHKIGGLYPVVEVTFKVQAAESHFHLPLLLSPKGYTTYRGS